MFSTISLYFCPPDSVQLAPNYNRHSRMVFAPESRIGTYLVALTREQELSLHRFAERRHKLQLSDLRKTDFRR
jgi:hypothetical protein